MTLDLPVCISVLYSPVQLDDFEAYLKDMSKDSAYKFSLQFEVKNSNIFPMGFPNVVVVPISWKKNNLVKKCRQYLKVEKFH